MMLVLNYTEWLRPLPYFALGYVLLKSSQVILLLLPFPQCPGEGRRGDRERGFLPGLAIANISELGASQGMWLHQAEMPQGCARSGW